MTDDTTKPAPAPEAKSDKDKLAESLLAGLAEENENPDAADERFNVQAMGITKEDREGGDDDDDDDSALEPEQQSEP